MREFYFNGRKTGTEMTVPLLLGCMCLGFGPGLALFIITVASDAQLVIVIITR